MARLGLYRSQGISRCWLWMIERRKARGLEPKCKQCGTEIKVNMEFFIKYGHGTGSRWYCLNCATVLHFID